MADTTVVEAEGDADAPREAVHYRLKRNWARRLAGELLALFIGLLALLAVGLVILDTAPGHRWIVDQIVKLETASGLKFRIGRIEGSIFGKSTLRNFEVLDKNGVFFRAPTVELDWTPTAYLYNKLSIASVHADRARLIRRPELKPSARKGATLPGFDIHIGRLSIDRLEIGQAVTGTERVGRIVGAADVRSGRALVNLIASVDGSDQLRIALDAEPDGDRFDLEVRARSAANGVLPALFGSKRPLQVVITGDGTWRTWRGSAAVDLSGQPAGRLQLTADEGRFGLRGVLSAAQFLKGRTARLAAPVIRVSGDATLKDRLLDGKLTLGTNALRAVASGALDLGSDSFRSVRIGVDLLRPPALFPNMTGRNVRLLVTLNGPFDSAIYTYRLTAPSLTFDRTGFVDVRAEGRGKLSPWPMKVPLHLQARAITGIGQQASDILANASLDGVLTVTPKFVRGDNLQLRSAQLSGKVALLIDLVTGRFEIMLSGGLKRYFIEGFGLVDVLTDLRVVPGPNGQGSVVTGSAKAWVRRLDNSFFKNLTGGLPRLETNLSRGADGVLRFTNLQVYSPKLRLSGEGVRRKDGTFHITARGRQAQYGRLRMVLDGNIARPRVELFLDRPMESLGLSNVRLLLNPTAAGFAYRASGGSKLGPFTSNGQILLPRGGAASIAIAALDVNGAHGEGRLVARPGGFDGRLDLSGSGLAGSLLFSPLGGAQKIEAHLNADNLNLPGALTVRSGRLDGAIVLGDGRTSLTGVVNARGVELSGLTIARITANGNLVNGIGQIRAAVAGRRGADFAFNAIADVAPDEIRLTGRGEVDRRPLVLEQAAVLTRLDDGGWQLSPTRVAFAGGKAVVSGNSGDRPSVQAQLQSMPLSVLNIVSPNLDFGGRATGSLEYAWKGGRSGKLNLTVRGLTRSGLVLASEPIDLGVAAVLTGNKAGIRAVAVSDGKTIGRAQARFAPLGGGAVMAELLRAPMFAQLRFQGAADTLWRLSGIEIFDLTGPAAIGADIGGSLANPVIRGSLRTQNARLESPVTGTVIEGLETQGRFDGSRFVFSRLSGRTPGGGTIQGSGTIAFADAQTLLDLRFQANKARLLNRDDIAATVTGPLQIRSNGGGGTISGKLHLDNGSFTLGQASGASEIPKLQVRHTGLDRADVIEAEQLRPWRLDVDVAGRDLAVRGLGIRSSWTTDLHVGGVANAPALSGRADLVRGNYEFAGRTFRLERGNIRFRGESPPDPLLDIRAEAQVQGLDATILVQGSGLKPEISFASVPQLPQDELLSRILFGTSITNLSAPEALQLASAVAALNSGTGSLDPINAVRNAVGLDRLRILPADIATGQRTSIAAGKYLTRKIYVEVITDGRDYSATRIEYQVTRWLSLLSSISTIGRASVNVRVSKDY
ncbi:translocation/assembly module TamB domain-containing protein [Sphingomonas sabuli]|uniref:Translocation/assembly module TamB domain-containing protein n=1 Tax=Sphingomonas sabuli TaxID=2764186 RepID=A0A7G9L4C6_9SPHN|nr:translocation/assembly module TamB domain-containing protein [Sphingomonas sabuli]QNM83475.1 translocation/assembly module TamB domain-containing protein [Sphingomonas sabuli]